MGKSARILGQLLHLTAEEMNELFKLNGFLEGEPGDYQVTEEGEPYATERDEHRGPGGYAWYNRDWTVRTWDDSVLDAMDTSPEMIQEARDNVSERRRARRMGDVEEESDEEALVEEATDDDLEDYGPYDYLDTGTIVKGLAIAGAVVGAIVAAPHIKKFYQERVKPTCKRAWCKITKKPYEPLVTPVVPDEQPAELPEQSETTEQKDGE